MRETNFLNSFSIPLKRTKKEIDTFECVHANTSEFINVGMIDFCEESDFGGNHGIFFWQEKFKFEDTAYSRQPPRTNREIGKASKRAMGGVEPS